MKESTSILAISDIHVGCPRLNPTLLHNRFKKFLYPQITSDISILFICGDFFDTLLTMNVPSSFEAMEIIKELKHLCRSVGCDLRILRGTATHDRNQPRHFINGEPEGITDVKLFETMSIERHEKTGLDILYMPDNLVSNDIYEDIRKLLESHGLKHVDLLVHHGYFKHMLPEALLTKGLPNGCLEVEKIKKYVHGFVLNGHVHIGGIYENVISIGSFDRLAHGEEDPKGFYRIDIETDGTHCITGEKCDIYKFTFIENTDANKFFTYDMRSFQDNQQAMDWFMSKVDKFRDQISEGEIVRIRLVTDDGSLVEGCTAIAKKVSPQIHVEHQGAAKRSQMLDNVATNLEELPQISPDNLQDLLDPILKKKDPMVDLEKMHGILKVIKEGK